MEPEELKKILKLHKEWIIDDKKGEQADLSWADLKGADLEGADLKRADLEGADLKGADLKGADLDFSSGFTFKCTSFGAIIDLRIGAQMAYHFCRMKSADPEVIVAQQALTDLANKFHRVRECGKIEVIKDGK